MNSPKTPWLSRFVWFYLLFATALSYGCQEKLERRVALTQEQWKQVREKVSDERPKPQHEIGAVFGEGGEPLIELVGYDLSAKSLVTNKNFTITWYWRAFAKPDKNWKIFVHLAPKNGSTFQNLDHHPVDNLYQTTLWEADQYVKDAQNTKLRAGFPSSGADILVGFFEEQTGKRLELLDAGAGKKIEDGKLRVGEVSTKNDKTLVAYHVDEAPVLDGKINDQVWRIAARTQAFVAAGDGKPVDFSTNAKALYTDDALYLAFDAKDKDIRTVFTKRDDKLWEQDCIEVYLNPDGDSGSYWELQISPGDSADPNNPPIFDAYFEKHRQPAWEIAKNRTLEGLEARIVRKGSLNSKGKDRDTGYTLEMKIPFATIDKTPGAIELIKLPNKPPKQGDTWRMNFFRVDHNLKGEKKSTRHAAWSPAGGDFHNLEAFGTLEFGEHRNLNNRTENTTPRPPKEARARSLRCPNRQRDQRRLGEPFDPRD